MTIGHFYIREWRTAQRSYYQPVRLIDAGIVDDHLHRLRLGFANPAYARVFARANEALVAARILKVETTA